VLLEVVVRSGKEVLCGRLPWRKKRYTGKVFDEMHASLFAEL
jgi:hypothetical protein